MLSIIPKSLKNKTLYEMIPGHYIVNRDGQIFVEILNNEESYRRDCSWFVRKDLFFPGFTSFESVHQPGYYVRHSNRRLQVWKKRKKKKESKKRYAGRKTDKKKEREKN